MTNSISLEEISEIARGITRDYSPKELPDLENISWAFPIKGPNDRHIVLEGGMDRIPNTQETAAWYQLGVFTGIHNAINHLINRRTLPWRNDDTPYTHIFACDNHFGDMSHQQWKYFGVLPEEVKKKKDLERFTRPCSYFWDNIPGELVKEVLMAYQILRSRGRSLDKWGFWDSKGEKKVNSVFDDPALTKQYITHLKNASELGREYFHKVVQNRNRATRYPQLILDTNVTTWDEDTEFQLGFWEKGEPSFLYGKGVKEYDGKNITLVHHLPRWADRRGSDETWSFTAPVDVLKKFKKSLWKVVLPQDDK